MDTNEISTRVWNVGAPRVNNYTIMRYLPTRAN